MADMYDCGVFSFERWAKQLPSPAYGYCHANRWYGEFNPNMTGAEANIKSDHVGKITTHGKQQFIRGWEYARQKYLQESSGEAS